MMVTQSPLKTVGSIGSRTPDVEKPDAEKLGLDLSFPPRWLSEMSNNELKSFPADCEWRRN